MNLFKTFFIGGYECADMMNRHRKRVDLISKTGHDIHVEEDYRLLSAAGMSTVREGIRWSIVEKQPYQYDFLEVKNRIATAEQMGIQQLWDVCHFGYPDHLAPTHPEFIDRFVAVCRAFTELYRSCTNAPLIITPINEISFLSYLSNVGCTVPFKKHCGSKIKYALCKAVIKATDTIRAIDPYAKIMSAEPLIRIHPKKGMRMSRYIQLRNEAQFEATDIITGRLKPELGGKPDNIDIMGFNYYYNNQWEHRGRGVCWEKERERRDFPNLLKAAADRYSKPVVLTETGHFNDHRSQWMQQITEECIQAIEMGVDLRGICIYPVLDRPDWDHLTYIPCGMWGYNNQTKERFPEPEYLAAVQKCMFRMHEYFNQRSNKVHHLEAAVA